MQRQQNVKRENNTMVAMLSCVSVSNKQQRQFPKYSHGRVDVINPQVAFSTRDTNLHYLDQRILHVYIQPILVATCYHVYLIHREIYIILLSQILTIKQYSPSVGFGLPPRVPLLEYIFHVAFPTFCIIQTSIDKNTRCNIMYF